MRPAGHLSGISADLHDPRHYHGRACERGCGFGYCGPLPDHTDDPGGRVGTCGRRMHQDLGSVRTGRLQNRTTEDQYSVCSFSDPERYTGPHFHPLCQALSPAFTDAGGPDRGGRGLFSPADAQPDRQLLQHCVHSSREKPRAQQADHVIEYGGDRRQAQPVRSVRLCFEIRRHNDRSGDSVQPALPAHIRAAAHAL